MHILRFALIIVLFLATGAACTNPESSEIEELKKKADSLQQEIDSLKQLPPLKDSIKRDTSPNTETAHKPKESTTITDGRLRAGKHNLTLQWISWDEPGSVMIQPSEDGWFSIEGGQKRRGNNDYLSINGMIRQISATELEFKGEIKSVVETINGGKPCIRTGTKIFKTTKNRKYWRLQDMINCEGGMLTDYVDIYF